MRAGNGVANHYLDLPSMSAFSSAALSFLTSTLASKLLGELALFALADTGILFGCPVAFAAL